MADSKKKETNEKDAKEPIIPPSSTKTQDTYLDSLLTPLIKKFKQGEDDGSLLKGLENLNKIAEFDSKFEPVKGTDFSEGVIGYRGYKGKNPLLTVACGKSMVREITLKKFIAMVENLDDPKSATIMLQNFDTQGKDRDPKGQILARINYKSSAISIIQGVTGRVIKGARDIALFDNYYIDRSDLTAFYLAAKAQISNEDTLEEMIQTYEGWKAFEVPLDPFNPSDK